jgi:hypothetical protein
MVPSSATGSGGYSPRIALRLQYYRTHYLRQKWTFITPGIWPVVPMVWLREAVRRQPE